MPNRGILVLLVSLTGAFSVTLAMAAPATPVTPAVPATPPKFTPGKAPLAPPIENDVSRAYAFRTRLLGSPQCQRFAAESDTVFLDTTLDDEHKAVRLKSVGAEAKANSCLTPPAAAY